MSLLHRVLRPAASRPLLTAVRSYATTLPDQPQKLTIGERLETTVTFGAAEVEAFARLSGDTNPLHLDNEYASTTMFGRPIVHGVLMNALLSGILGTKLPGEGSIFLWQDISFKAPLFVGEPVTARVEVAELHASKPVVTMKLECLDKDSKVLMHGQAKAMIRPELYRASITST